MATIKYDRIKGVRTLDGGPPTVQEVDEGASQTFVIGEIVNMVSGLATEISGDTPSVVYGVAAQDGHNTTAGQKVATFLVTPDTIFEANMKQSGLADHVLVQADLGITMAIQRDTTNSKVALNSSTKAGTSVRVFVHAVAKNSLVGDTNARVLFTFLPNFIQFLGTS